MRRNNFTIESCGHKLKVFRIGATARLRARAEREPSNIEVSHTHFTYEVFFVTDGELELITEGGASVYKEAFVIIPPKLSHYSLPSGSGSYCLLFSFEKQGTPLEAFISDKVTATKLNSEIAFYIQKASEKLDEYSDIAAKDAELLITLLFNSMIRALLPTNSTESALNGASRHISSIEALINGNLKNRVTLSYIAKSVFLSERQVSRIIVKEYGCSLPKLLNDKRLAASEMLLKNTSLPISRIAEEIGITNESYFYTLFKKKYGVSPLKYRKKLSQK